MFTIKVSVIRREAEGSPPLGSTKKREEMLRMTETSKHKFIRM